MRLRPYWIPLVIGLALMAIGLLRQTEVPRLLAKATYICLECIGIG